MSNYTNYLVISSPSHSLILNGWMIEWVAYRKCFKILSNCLFSACSFSVCYAIKPSFLPILFVSINCLLTSWPAAVCHRDRTVWWRSLRISTPRRRPSRFKVLSIAWSKHSWRRRPTYSPHYMPNSSKTQRLGLLPIFTSAKYPALMW